MRRTTIGWMMPLARIDFARSSRRPSSMVVRGWNLFGRSRSVSTSNARSGAAAGASGISALSPRPSAGRFSTMMWLRLSAQGGVPREELSAERDIGLGAARFRVVGDRRHAVARRFAESDVPRDDRREHALLKEL